MDKLINNINKRSNANFVNRLKDPNRKVIKDWASNGIATHKMAYDYNQNGNDEAIVFPLVQEINSKLHDYTNPFFNMTDFPYGLVYGNISNRLPLQKPVGYKLRDPLDNAILNRDTIMMSGNDADRFTRNYKKYYKGFNKY